MNPVSDRQKLTATMARSFAWFSIGVAAAAGVVWGAAFYDLLVGDWTRFGVVGFCAVALSLTTYTLARTAVRPIG